MLDETSMVDVGLLLYPHQLVPNPADSADEVRCVAELHAQAMNMGIQMPIRFTSSTVDMPTSNSLVRNGVPRLLRDYDFPCFLLVPPRANIQPASTIPGARSYVSQDPRRAARSRRASTLAKISGDPVPEA